MNGLKLWVESTITDSTSTATHHAARGFNPIAQSARFSRVSVDARVHAAALPVVAVAACDRKHADGYHHPRTGKQAVFAGFLGAKINPCRVAHGGDACHQCIVEIFHPFIE